MDPVNLSGSVDPADLAWQAAGGAEESKRLKSQMRQLQAQIQSFSGQKEKGLLQSSTFWFGAALALFAIADSTQPIWFPWVSAYVPQNLGYLSGDTAVNVSLKLAGHILPVLVFLAGIIRGRRKAGGIRGWF